MSGMPGDERIRRLRNLRKGYDLTSAVGFWQQLYGEDLIEEYAALVRERDEWSHLAGKDIGVALARAEAAEAEVTRLREALERIAVGDLFVIGCQRVARDALTKATP